MVSKLTNRQLAELVRAARSRVVTSRCDVHLTVIRRGDPCLHCLMQKWTGRPVLSFTQIMERGL